MKMVNIIGPTPVNGTMRFIHENPIEVSEAEAKRLGDAGLLHEEPSDVAAPKAPSRSTSSSRRKRAIAPVSTPPSIPAFPPVDNGAADHD